MYLIKEINPKTSSPVENSLECWMTVMIMRRMRASIVCVSHKCGPLLSLSPFFALPLASLENAPIAMQWYTVRLCLRVKCFFSFCFKLGNTHHVMMRRKGRASVHLSLGASCQ